MGDPKNPPPTDTDPSAAEPPPPFNPRLDLIGYYDSDERGLPPRRPFWSELWRRRRPKKSGN